MPRLFTPRWIAAHLVVIAVVVTCVNLGLWQLDRLEQRRLENTVGQSRFQADPVDLQLLAAAAEGEEPTSLQYLKVEATGTFQPEHEVLVRSQVHQGSAGLHVITPLLLGDGRAVLVNRGWVPLTMDQVPVAAAPPPAGEVTITGWVEPSRERTGLGPIDPAEGTLSVVSRVDIGRIAQQVPFSLVPVYVVALGESDDELPIPVAAPDFSDEGPHLGYAVQWFGFALVGAVGYAVLLRRSLTGSGGRGNRQIVDDVETLSSDQL